MQRQKWKNSGNISRPGSHGSTVRALGIAAVEQSTERDSCEDGSVCSSSPEQREAVTTFLYSMSMLMSCLLWFGHCDALYNKGTLINHELTRVHAVLSIN